MNILVILIWKSLLGVDYWHICIMCSWVWFAYYSRIDCRNWPSYTKVDRTNWSQHKYNNYTYRVVNGYPNINATVDDVWSHDKHGKQGRMWIVYLIIAGICSKQAPLPSLLSLHLSQSLFQILPGVVHRELTHFTCELATEHPGISNYVARVCLLLGYTYSCWCVRYLSQ